MKTLMMTAMLAATLTVNAQQRFVPGKNKVEFSSEGIRMVGNLYLPTNYKNGQKFPVVISIGPFTQVKEQLAQVYSTRMMEAGFAAFAFDFRFWGESGGEPRSFESPKDKIQDIKNAVSFLSTLGPVDANRIGIIGACFGAGYVAQAVSEDARIKSWGTVAAWINEEESLKKIFGEETLLYRDRLSDEASAAYASTGKMQYAPAYEIGNNKAAMFADLDYYGNPKRGAVPSWKNEYALISHKAWHEFSPLPIASKITTPVLFVHSDGSALPEVLKELYNKVQGEKKLYWTTGNHLDFYDQEKEVTDASSALATHFKQTL
jgi:uncharacterized protein